MRKTTFLAALLAIACWGCVNDIAEIDALFEDTDTKVEVGSDIEILYSDSAYVRIRLKSPTLHRHLNRAEPKDEFPDGLHVDFLNRNQGVESTLDADHGIRYPRKSTIVVSENVILINQRGEQLETSELTWDEKKQRVSTDRFVKFTKPEEVIYAYGFTANQDFTEYQLYSVVARVKVDDMKESNP